MKLLKNIAIMTALSFAVASCNDFIDVPPTGVVEGNVAYEHPEEMVTAAYAMLGDCWYTYPFNLWPYGDVSSDDCYKGGSGLNDIEDYHKLECWNIDSRPGPFDELWYRLYCAVSRCNRALIALELNGEKVLGPEIAERRAAEVHFLRGHFYFKLVTLFRQVPWIDEAVFRQNAYEKTSNVEFTYEELMQKIIKEFEYAVDLKPEGARVHGAAARAYLAKCYLTLAWGNGYEESTGEDFVNEEYMKKVVEYTDNFDAYGFGYLEDFGDIFLPDFKNSKESVFAVQTSDYHDDNTTFGRANWSNMLNGCHGMWSCGWDFHKPSQNLVNAFKTKNGLPMFDDYNQQTAYPVKGGATVQKWDPRLFHTVGMPSWPYKYETEYFVNGQSHSLVMTMDHSRTPNTYGYYTSLKEVPQRSQGETFNGSWQAFAMNDYIFRYTDVMLMRAEALIECGRLAEAHEIINDIRTRAMKSIDKHIAYAKDFCEIDTYPDVPASKDEARLRLRWERRLEMAMEGDRFFALRRWGIASQTLNSYFESEAGVMYEGKAYAQYLEGAVFTKGKNEYLPIPYNQMFYIPKLYTQNRGYID